MRKDITPDMLNYNKFPGPKFVFFDDQLHSDDIELKLVDNYREGFKLESFEQRFSEILLKYDYILGDWSSDELRLRGFYQDDKTVRSDSKIGRLEEYLKEYCNFGCAYFLLENPAPRQMKQEEGRPRRRRDNRKRRTYQKAERESQDFKLRKQNRSDRGTDRKSNKKQRSSRPDRRHKQDSGSKQHFTIRKKEK